MTVRRVTARHETWPLSRPFAISRGTKTAAEVVVVTVTEAGVTGQGECVPYPRYSESPESILTQVHAVAAAVASGQDRQALLRQMPPGAARNAIDGALWDLEAKSSGIPAWQRAGLSPPGPVVTAVTIGIDTPDAMAAAARSLAAQPLLKLKLDRHAVVDRVAAVRRAAPLARLLVDANESWSRALLADVLPGLADLGVELIEQPLPADRDGELDGLTPVVPLAADESCHTPADLSRLAGRYQAVNVKLDKAGGLTTALDLVDAAERAGFQVMVGCMVATSLAIAPALLIAGRARWVDLDGPLWLRRDREHGIRFTGGVAEPPSPALWG